MKIGFVYLPGRLERISEFQNFSKNSQDSSKRTFHPTEFFYGAFELMQKGHSVGLHEVRERPRKNILKYIAENTLHKRYLPVKTYPGIIDAVWFLLKDLNKYDTVVGTTPGIAFSLAIWKKLGRLKPPIIGIQCGILNYDLHPLRIAITRYLHRSMASQIFGNGELEAMLHTYKLYNHTVEINPFGVDMDFWKDSPNETTNDYILAIGNDALRDFDTLIQVAEKTSLSVRIVTKRSIQNSSPNNVRIFKGAWNSREFDDNAILQLYQNSLAVAIPLKESFQPSGQSVALQAMACRKPVILTRTRGLWDPVGLKHQRNIIFVSPGKVEDWVEKITGIINYPEITHSIGRQAREYVAKYGDIRQFASRLERRCQIEIGKSKI